MTNPVYSLIIPVYNEEDTLPELCKQLTALMSNLDGDTEVILVDDGSRDDSFHMMQNMHKLDPRFKTVRFARNFGHQTAITAGMDLSSGEAIIIMDADLQDPPEVVLEMTKKWREGYDIVYGVREDREGETWFKRITASLFYRLLRKLTDLEIPVDVGDFRLVDRRAIIAFKSLREHSRYVRGMFSWVGFNQTGVKYRRSERFAGETKYPFKKMLKLATDGIMSFSTIPLRLALHIGFLVAVLSFAIGVITVILKMAGIYTAPGWASLVVVSSFLGGVQLILIGFLGEYIGRIYEEVRNRPLYIASSCTGFSSDAISSINNAIAFDDSGRNDAVRFMPSRKG